MVGYNYVDRWRDRREKFYSIDRHRYPGAQICGHGEAARVFGARGVYATDQSDSLFFERASNDEIEVEQLQKFIQTYDYVSGDFLWTGIDYLGEAKWPNKLAATGATRYLRIQEGQFLFLPEPVDEKAGAASFSALELGGT